MATTKALDEDGVVLLASDIKTLSDATYPSNAAIASAYDSTAAYSVGDYCLRNGLLYKCNTAIGTGGETWTAAHWTQTKASDEFGAGGSPFDSDIIADEYDSSSAYSIGDYCIYDDLLYICNTAIATGGETWTSAHWTATNVISERGDRRFRFKDVAVPVSSFTVTQSYADYPYRASVTLSGVSSSMIPDVVFGLNDAVGGIFAPVATTYNGGVYIYSNSLPVGTLSATISNAAFLEKVSGEGTMTFTFNGTWDTNPESYGITLSGTSNSGDTIVVEYDKSQSSVVMTVNASIIIPLISVWTEGALPAGGGGGGGGTATASIVATITLPASGWVDKTQTITISGITIESGMKVDLQADKTAMDILAKSQTTDIFVINNGGTLTAYASAYAPNANVTLQCTISEVETTGTVVIGDRLNVPPWSEYIFLADDMYTTNFTTEGQHSIQIQNGWMEITMNIVAAKALTANTEYTVANISQETKAKIGNTYKDFTSNDGAWLLNTWENSSYISVWPKSSVASGGRMICHEILPITM